MILATDVAEYLVKEGVPFRDAHWKAGQLVRYCLDNGRSLLDLTLSEWKAIIPEAKEDLLSILSLKESVARRQTYGGTGFICVERQIEEGDGWLAYQKKRDNACFFQLNMKPNKGRQKLFYRPRFPLSENFQS